MIRHTSCQVSPIVDLTAANRLRGSVVDHVHWGEPRWDEYDGLEHAGSQDPEWMFRWFEMRWTSFNISGFALWAHNKMRPGKQPPKWERVLKTVLTPISFGRLL